jgi:hypothetical protein
VKKSPPAPLVLAGEIAPIATRLPAFKESWLTTDTTPSLSPLNTVFQPAGVSFGASGLLVVGLSP